MSFLTWFYTAETGQSKKCLILYNGKSYSQHSKIENQPTSDFLVLQATLSLDFEFLYKLSNVQT